ncbi:MAG: flagellar basal body P-ring protein FlgI [bacterium]
MIQRISLYFLFIFIISSVPGFAQNTGTGDSSGKHSFLIDTANTEETNPTAGNLFREIVEPDVGEVKVRLKDIARLQGVRKNQLFGVGLITGLSGTGDDTNTVKFTAQALSNMLNNLGIAADPADIRVKNFASVMVTADLPPFSKPGDLIDVTISSMGNAKSLEGGTLVLTPLQAANGEIYAVAQGGITLGGFGATGQTGAKVKKNFLTVGRIPSGAIVEKEVPFTFKDGEKLTWVLRQNDFTTAKNVAASINRAFPLSNASAIDPSTVKMRIPSESIDDPVDFVSKIEQLEISVDSISKVVINEKNGTIVFGGNVKILPVSIAHGNITISVSERYSVSQPGSLSGGSTVVIPESAVTVTQGAAKFVPVTSENLISSLNQMGATAQDIVAIFQAIKAAGALEAELEII